MKKLYFLLFAILIGYASIAQVVGIDVFINEIHYDNISSDVNEGVEIAGPAGINLAGYTITPYNGNGGTSYSAVSLSGVIPDEGNGYGTLFFAISGLQNGAPDGIALDDGGNVQFLSYEGSFSASDGPANGMMSTDIGVQESNSTTASTESLQLIGTGTVYSNFSWSGPVTSSGGTINSGQSFGAAIPSLFLVDGEPSGSTIDVGPEDLSGDLEFGVTNFTVGEPGTGTEGDGYITWSIDEQGAGNHDGGVSYDISNIIAFAALDPNKTYVLTAELLDNDDNPWIPAVTYTLTANTFGYNSVANLSAARNGTDGLYYEITGEVIITFITGNFRNQIFMQDSSGGILIDDNDDVITTVYNNGDGITGFKGQLGEFADVLQLIPTIDPGVASSSGNVVAPQVITINDLIANSEDYESELMQINSVTFADGDGFNTFASGQDYDISDSSGGPLVFRTNYDNDGMDGELIPSSAVDITVIAGQYFSTLQVYPRQPSEILSNNKLESKLDFALFPNPTATGKVTISSRNSSVISAQVFDILGKQVLQADLNNNELNVSSLRTGLYIVKLTQDEATVTKKLVIK